MIENFNINIDNNNKCYMFYLSVFMLFYTMIILFFLIAKNSQLLFIINYACFGFWINQILYFYPEYREKLICKLLKQWINENYIGES